MTTETADAECEPIRARAIDAAYRCIRTLLIAMGRDYLHCGKAACARSRRCRGFACEPDSGAPAGADSEA